MARRIFELNRRGISFSGAFRSELRHPGAAIPPASALFGHVKALLVSGNLVKVYYAAPTVECCLMRLQRCRRTSNAGKAIEEKTLPVWQRDRKSSDFQRSLNGARFALCWLPKVNFANICNGLPLTFTPPGLRQRRKILNRTLIMKWSHATLTGDSVLTPKRGAPIGFYDLQQHGAVTRESASVTRGWPPLPLADVISPGRGWKMINQFGAL